MVGVAQRIYEMGRHEDGQQGRWEEGGEEGQVLRAQEGFVWVVGRKDGSASSKSSSSRSSRGSREELGEGVGDSCPRGVLVIGVFVHRGVSVIVVYVGRGGCW